MLSKDELEASICRESFKDFVVRFWHVVVPEQLHWNWHMDVICEHIQEAAERVFRNEPKKWELVVNIPPGTSKSSIASIFFPAWIWTRMITARCICASYSYPLAMDLSRKSRDVIISEKYKRLFGDVGIREDQNAKGHFANEKGGMRYAAGTGGSVTGFHGHFLIVDDPLDPQEAVSEASLLTANRWVSETLPSRKVNKEVTVTILIMQRLHQNDPSVVILKRAEEGVPVKHIKLPAEIQGLGFDQVRPRKYARMYKDGLLDPNRISRKVLQNALVELGQYGYAGQMLQSPVPLGGGMFKADKIRIESPPPFADFVRIARAWDKSGTEAGGAYSCGVKMARDNRGRFWILDVVRGQWDSGRREQFIKQIAMIDSRKIPIWVEQEPGPIWEEDPVQLVDGSVRPLKDIRVGDVVINGQGVGGKVKGVHVQGKLPTVLIRADSGRVIRAALDHPFLTPRGWTRAGDLTVGDVLGLASCPKIRYTSKPTPEECRLAGYFVGDGCCTATRRNGKESATSINANIVCSDDEQGDDIIDCGESIGARVLKGGSRGWAYYLSGGGRDWLRQRGLAGKRTHNKVVPDWVVKASDECVANFIGAYFACDGSASADPKRPYVEFYSINLPLLEQVRSLLLRFGIYSMLRSRTFPPEMMRKRSTPYRLTLRKKDDSMARFAARIPVFGKKAQPLGAYRRSSFDETVLPDPIVAITPGGVLPCRCLTVDGDSFLVRDVIVHNSGGKESAQSTLRNLAGWRVHLYRPTGKKEARADPFSVQVNGDNVYMVPGQWNKPFLEELSYFPLSRYKDQVDAASMAFMSLTAPVRVGGLGGYK